MKKNILGAVIVGLLMTLTTSAWALTITPETLPQWTGTFNENLDAAGVAAKVGSVALSEFYKADVGVADVWDFASSYETVYSNSATDPSDATITYVGGPAIVANPLYLLVKDGNNNPYWYIFDLVSLRWNGTETLELKDFWPNRGAISHVAIFGVAAVPEPATLILIGLGLLGIAGIRRKK